MGRGGVKDAPITVEALKPNTVILDGQKKWNDIIHLDNAPYITIRNLTVRWFKQTGISLHKSPNVRIEYCRFFNYTWANAYTDGIGVRTLESPFGVYDHNIGARMATLFYLGASPGSTVTHNSTTAMMYGGLTVASSTRDLVAKNNCFAFTGNDSIAFYEQDESVLKTAKIDYNNYAASIYELPPAERLPMPFKYVMEGKAIVGFEAGGKAQRFRSLVEWQKFSGQDAHSIFADPQWIDPATNRWDIKQGSPNHGKGEHGATIGATGFGVP